MKSILINFKNHRIELLTKSKWKNDNIVSLRFLATEVCN
ncbi:hypothetical protein M595_3088 [Lyngbya aestuarii BL J]|uniref:Uncharacterized protein n=1 Tax=Lyngbya aestuarii BL J TaxID=1348334 RepID=U7QIQ7_9CYAN|nr:hypothetical protein M595_3088 [Lyngbya aestuarii BL J]